MSNRKTADMFTVVNRKTGMQVAFKRSYEEAVEVAKAKAAHSPSSDEYLVFVPDRGFKACVPPLEENTYINEA